MKTFTSIFAFLFVSSVAFAQSVDVPAKEFTVSVSENGVSVNPGESKQVTVTLVRSRSFAKQKVSMGVSNTLPEGITVQYAQQDGLIDSTTATIAVAPSAAPGTYQIILSGTMAHKTKGSIIKVSVGSDNVASK